jgi:hypothetical protein
MSLLSEKKRVDLAEEHMACRRCFGLAYASQREPVRRRGLMKAQKIRMGLGGSPSMMDRFPDRPKGMRWKTYNQLQAAHDQAAVTLGFLFESVS